MNDRWYMDEGGGERRMRVNDFNGRFFLFFSVVVGLIKWRLSARKIFVYWLNLHDYEKNLAIAFFCLSRRILILCLTSSKPF